MAKLSYRTRGNSSPQGKEKVYFSCHPDDLNIYLEPICADILRTQNCAIYYDEEPNIPWDQETMEANLGTMQLFVFPITSNFLMRKNRARDAEIKFAKTHHIPLLPLMQEPDLEIQFNEICGNIQYLDKEANQKDPTELPYEQKLANFLATVLLGDNLAATVRSAFYDSVFLSYRKKDRKYAQRLMSLIHRFGFCRDIAIWYDEFLVPGEDYNDAILHAIEESGLSVIAITPNVLEEQNYIRTTEYPAMIETRKTILPVDMTGLREDKLTELMHLYQGMPSPIKETDHEKMYDYLYKQFGKYARREDAQDPQHLYLIGLAYMNGINTEKNSKWGAGLMQKAAELGNAAAMKKMSQMYRYGDCVPKDNKKAIEWQKKLVDLLKNKYLTYEMPDVISSGLKVEMPAEQQENENKFQKAGEELLHEMEDLAYCYMLEEDKNNAKSTYESMLNLARKMEMIGSREGKKYINLAYVKLGDLHMSEPGMEEAEEYYLTAVSFCESFLKEEPDDAEFLIQLAGDYVKLGNLFYQKSKMILRGGDWERACANNASYKAQGSGNQKVYSYTGDAKEAISFAKEWYIKAQNVCEAVNTREQYKSTESAKIAFINICEGLGDIFCDEKNISDARTWYSRAIETNRKLLDETNGGQGVYSYRSLTEKLGDLEKKEEHYELAGKYYTDAINGWIQEAEMKGNVHAKNQLAKNLARMGDIRIFMRKPQEARELYTMCNEVLCACREELGAFERTMQSLSAENSIMLSYSDMLRTSYDDPHYFETDNAILELLCHKEKEAIYYAKKISDYKEKPQSKFYEFFKEDHLQECHSLLSALLEAGEYWKILGEDDIACQLYERVIREAKIMFQKNEGSEWLYRSLNNAYYDMAEVFMKRKNYEEALNWAEKRVDVSKNCCHEYTNVKSFKQLWRSYSFLADIYAEKGDTESAMEVLVTFLSSIASAQSMEQIPITYNDIADPIADCCHEMGKLAIDMPAFKNRSIRFFQSAHDLWEELVYSNDTESWLKEIYLEYMADVLREMDQDSPEFFVPALHGDELAAKEKAANNKLEVYFDGFEENIVKIRKSYEANLKIQEEQEETGTEEGRRALINTYNNLGSLCKLEGNLPKAREYYEKDQKTREELEKETGTEEGRRALINTCNNLGSLCKLEGNLPKAREYYEKELRIKEELEKETGATESCWVLLSNSYNNLGILCKLEGNLIKAQEYYEKALQFYKNLAEDTGMASSYDNLAWSYYHLGMLRKPDPDKEMLKQALEIWEQLATNSRSVYLESYKNNIKMVNQYLNPSAE